MPSDKDKLDMENQGEIILYQPDSEVKLEVRLEEETVWLTQAQIVELFHSSKANSANTLKTYTSRRNWMKAQLFGISEQFGKKANGKSCEPSLTTTWMPSYPSASASIASEASSSVSGRTAY